MSIAHKLAATSGADRIVVLSQGELVEQGTHDDLWGANGLYRKLYELQQVQPPQARQPA